MVRGKWKLFRGGFIADSLWSQSKYTKLCAWERNIEWLLVAEKLPFCISVRVLVNVLTYINIMKCFYSDTLCRYNQTHYNKSELIKSVCIIHMYVYV